LLGLKQKIKKEINKVEIGFGFQLVGKKLTFYATPKMTPLLHNQQLLEVRIEDSQFIQTSSAKPLVQ